MDITGKLPVNVPSAPIGVTLLAAFALHALIILGVSFDLQRENPPAPERTLDVTLVIPSKKPEPVEQADFLAQADQQGGGEKIIEDRPASPMGNPQAQRKEKPAPELQRAGTRSRPEPRNAPPVVTQKKAAKKQTVRKQTPKVKAQPRPQLSQLLASTQREIDQLTAELDKRAQQASSKSRRKHINASTQEYLYAAYLEDWRKKVERIGNLNYPDEAKRNSLYGNLILHVAIRADGSIEQMHVRKRSGHKVLDDAALRIVRLAAPFAPFPPAIRKEVDVLDITRSWQFRPGGLRTSN